MKKSTGWYRTPLRQASSPWTQARVEYVRLRAVQGASGRQIARELGCGISRHAVLAKMQRLAIVERSLGIGRHGCAGETSPPGPGSRLGHHAGRLFRQRCAPKWVVNAKPYVENPLLDADIPHSQRRSLVELRTWTCRWPVGDPSTAGFFFCGAESLPNRSYCAAHCARAYRPAEKAFRHTPTTRSLGTILEYRGVGRYPGWGGETAAERQWAWEGR